MKVILKLICMTLLQSIMALVDIVFDDP